MDNYEEYEVFTVTTSEGKEVEMAVVDEFEVDEAEYVVAALVEGDTINEDGVFVYKVVTREPELEVAKITDAEEYARVTDAYSEMM